MHGGADVRNGAAYHDIDAGGAIVQECGVDGGDTDGDILGRYTDMVRRGGVIFINRL